MAKKTQKTDILADLSTGEITTLPRLRHSENYVLTEQDMEYVDPDLPSLTLPDDVMSMTEIFNRFAGGRPVDASYREPVYHGDDILIPDLRRLDLVEIGEMLENVRSNRDLLEQQLEQEMELANQIEAEKKAKEMEAQNEALLAEYTKRRNALEK